MHPNTHTYTIHKKTDIKERERNIKLWKSFVKIDVRKTGSHSRSNLNNSINYFLSSSPNSTGFAKFVYSKLSSLFFWMESTFLLIYRISFRIGIRILIFFVFSYIKKNNFMTISFGIPKNAHNADEPTVVSVWWTNGRMEYLFERK